MAEALVSVAVEVAKCLVAPFGHRCSYVTSYDSYVRQLEHEAGKLHSKRENMKDSIDEAENNGKTIKDDVKVWATQAETDANEARRVLDDNETAKKTCFYGWLPNPKERYRLGREARRIAERIQKLIDRIPSGEVYRDVPPGLVDGAPEVIFSARDTIVKSRDSILRNIMSALGDEKNKVIGIYGPGGVGKTTLLETVKEKLKNEKKTFHMIAKSKVSQNLDLKKIQDDIAYALGLNLNEMSDEGRKDRLFRRLQKNPMEKVLIILDDLWKELNLRDVGIPSGDESRGCQVLLTSRYKDVLQNTSAFPIFHLEGLKDDEALVLFEKTVGDRLQDDKELKAIAPQVVKKLAGLPLLIKSVATFLKDSNASAWRNALIKIDAEEMETIVTMSYNHLKSEDTKSLFLLCGLIGGTIRVETLFILGMGLGLFGEFGRTMQDARDRLDNMLNELRSACLLLDGGDDKNNVTIHDLYSEVVVSTPFRGQNSLRMNSNDGSWPKEKLEKCWAICFVNVVGDRLVELMRGGFPDLKILMLSQPGSWIPAHRHDEGDCCRLDFTCKKELQVLYLRCMHIPTLPPSIEILKNLQSFYMDRCDVGDVAILGKLKALQILSFAESTISRLPKEIGELANLKLLNLSNCRALKKIEPGALKGLINLKELYMRGISDQWIGEEEKLSESCNAKLAELKSLTKLIVLEISIPDSTILLEDGDLPFGNLIRFRINIGNADKGEFEGLTAMMLNLEGCDSILSKEWVHKTLQKTQYLHLDGLTEFNEKSAHELCSRGFPKLKHLDIRNCSSIKYIVSSSNSAFPILESLFLKNLTNLEKICSGPRFFCKLKAIRVTKCNRLEYLWCLSHMHSFAQLEEIEVKKCDSMRAIVIDDAGKDIVAADNRVELPNVRRLKLANLPKMTSFCIGTGITLHGAPIQIMDSSVKNFISHPHGKKEAITATSDSQYAYSDSFFDRKVSLPSLEELHLESVGSFKSIWPRELPESSLDNLVRLSVSECSELLNVFPSSITGTLHNLSSIWICHCPSLESLFECGSLNSNTMEQTGVLLPELEGVPMREARRLSHVVKSDSQTILGLPNLEDVYVGYCSELIYLFPYAVATTIEKLKSLYISNCKQTKEVVAKEEGGRSEAGVLSFPFLTFLCISKCPNFEAFISNPTSVERPSGETTKDNDESQQPLFNKMVTFPTLRRLRIRGVQIKELWNNQIQDDSFCELRSLQLMGCDNLQRIAPSQVWKRLQRCLEILEVTLCRSIEIIYESDLTVAETGQLRSLVLHDLENLRQVWRYDSPPNINVPFPNLRDIEVLRCPRLRILFETFTAPFLSQIKWLQVGSCDDMELIADHGECEGATCTTITFSELDTLKLEELPKFRRYLPKKYHVEFPSLRAVNRVGCGKEPEQSDPFDLVGWEVERQREQIRDGE